MLELDTFRRHFKSPGEEQCDREANGHRQCKHLDPPVGRTDQVQREIRALQQYSALQDIDNTNH